MLTELTLHGFKSIRQLDQLKLSRLNVLIGANGAGKSNLISFFRLLNWMTASPGNLQHYVSVNGGANALLFDGAAVTPEVKARLNLVAEYATGYYDFTLKYAAPDTLYFAEEAYAFPEFSARPTALPIHLGLGHREAMILEAIGRQDQSSKRVLDALKQCSVYHLHNTSQTSRICQRWPMEDNTRLKDDGANLAPFLWRIRESHPECYHRIAETIRQIAPFFADFELEPVDNTIILRWRERGSDVMFGPHQASDGMLRIVALVTLLLQPENNLPGVIILDEPELGLHPYAINVVAGLLKSVSLHAQVILATQSMALIDYFDPEDIIVVDRRGRESVFRRLESESLKEWLGEYSLGELWQKNVIGGRPA